MYKKKTESKEGGKEEKEEEEEPEEGMVEGNTNCSSRKKYIAIGFVACNTPVSPSVHAICHCGEHFSCS